jgi:iron complex outermembrane receptor protein
MKLNTLTLAILFSFTSPLYAENYDENYSDEYFDDFYGSEEMVEIATGTKKQFHLLPAVASVITSDQIELMGANTIHQIIETVTGIHTYPSNVNRMNPSYSIRGIHTAENPQVLVLVNGVRTTYEFAGAKWYLFDVGVNLIERVEVIRGPGSAVYGADAFSGVINIITKGNNVPVNNEAGVKIGSFGTKSSWVNLGYQKDDLKLSLNAQWQKTDGDNDRFIGADRIGRSGALDTRHEYTDLHAQVNYQSFYANLWYLDLKGGTGAGAAQVLSDSDVTEGQQVSLQTGYKFTPMDNVDVDFKLQHQQYKHSTFFKIFPNDFVLGGVTYTDGYIGVPKAVDNIYKANVITTYSGLDNHFFRVEVGHQYSKETSDELKNFGPGIITEGQTEQDGTLTSVKGTPNIFIGNNSRRLSYLSVQDEWAFTNDWELTAGIRYDDYSDFGSTINPRLALVWQAQYNLTTKFLYGSAYRAPSFGDLYSSNNPVKLGNENLSAEQTDTVELVFDYRPHIDWVIALNLFKYQSTDLITYVNNQLENSLEQDGEGLELELQWQATSDLKVKLGYAFQNSEDSSGSTIADAPKNVIDATVSYKLNKSISLYMDSFWVMDRQREITDTRADIKDYVWTNLNLSYKVNDLKFNLTARNVFNANAREPSTNLIANDYPLESRGIWLSSTYQF